VKNEEFALSKRENSFLGKRLYEPSAKFKTQNSIIQNYGKAATIQNSKLKIQNSYSHSQIHEKFAHKFRKKSLTNSGKICSQIPEFLI